MTSRGDEMSPAQRSPSLTPVGAPGPTLASSRAGRSGLRRAGGFAALYVAAAYLAAIVYFVFLVDYPGTDAAAKITLLVDHRLSMYLMHLVSFEFVALALIVVTLAVNEWSCSRGSPVRAPRLQPDGWTSWSARRR